MVTTAWVHLGAVGKTAITWLQQVLEYMEGLEEGCPVSGTPDMEGEEWAAALALHKEEVRLPFSDLGETEGWLGGRDNRDGHGDHAGDVADVATAFRKRWPGPPLTLFWAEHPGEEDSMRLENGFARIDSEGITWFDAKLAERGDPQVWLLHYYSPTLYASEEGLREGLKKVALGMGVPWKEELPTFVVLAKLRTAAQGRGEQLNCEQLPVQGFCWGSR